MFLLFSKYNNIIKTVTISFILIVAQSYLPTIKISNSLLLYSDLLLLYLTFLVLNEKLYVIIIFAFFIGVFQDLIIQNDTVGLNAFLKVLAIYFISYLNKVKSLWSITFKLIYLLSIYFFHYFIYHSIFINQMTLGLTIFIFLESILNVFLFIIVDKVIHRSSSI